MKTFELFAGCGGLSQGLTRAGFDIRWANEIDPYAAKTFKAMHQNTKLFTEDANLLLQRLRDKDKDLPKPGEVELVTGGPPCQGFSGFNRHRRADDPRNSLVETFLGFVDYLHPRYVLMENVPGMLSMSGGRVVHLLLDALRSLGYDPALGILQAGNYGVPQSRWRVFIWAASEGERVPEFPFASHEFPRKTIFGATKFRDFVISPPKDREGLFWSLKPMVTVGDAIKGLPSIRNGGGLEEMPYSHPPNSDYQSALRGENDVLFDHITTNLSEINYIRCRSIPKKPNAGWLDLPDELKPKNLVRHGDDRYPNRFGRLNWNGSFNTILHRAEPYWGAVFHPTQNRVISVREAARAQGFSDSCKFYGPLSKKYCQVGNAVPPPLGYALGSELIRAAS